MTVIKPPFPYFGGKLLAAPLIWQRLGAVANYIAPFCGSLAVELNAPAGIRIMTLNDLDGFLVNFYRAVVADPEAVAHHLNYPVSEIDLFARHVWLVRQRDGLTQRLEADPAYYDAQVAGWWCWGACAWIGTGWCSGNGPWTVGEDGALARTSDQDGGVGRQIPHLGNRGRGVNRKLPHLDKGGRGVQRDETQGQRGLTLDEYGASLRAYLRQIRDMLRGARLICGDFRRVLTPAVTTGNGVTGVLLDPPYGEGAQEYAAGGNGDRTIADAAWDWAVANGGDPQIRIAYCAYDDGRALPTGWSKERWVAKKGYQSSEGKSGANPGREVIYFSPHCLRSQFGVLYRRAATDDDLGPLFQTISEDAA